MQIFNREALISGSPTKFIVNDDAIAFFPVNMQHKDTKVAGLSYEDEYRGNALAGLFTGTSIEIRYHKNFTDEHIRNIWNRVLRGIDSPMIEGAGLYYQGRELKLNR